MAAISDRRGLHEEDLVKKMQALNFKLAAICKENEDIRDSVEIRVVSLKHYLPLNSKEGMEEFFQVSVNITVTLKVLYQLNSNILYCFFSV